ncbi:PREDICTED: splicing regulator RBM11 [Sturnus vulgaris]|uniref:splicing regulator RBM11 n=1 Tax=Sturnus vulgaris TaxID=9172 RepID=UPI00071A4883|nr:PREDICTED: splicing regulator RBM11 [Sturnus vulgaris]
MSSPRRSEAAEQILLVGNLESRVREEILYELFLQAGPLTKVTICEDKEGKPKSFGYVCFKHKVSVPYAKALLDGIHLYGRPITVQYWRESSHSPELDSCTDGFEHHVDLDSPPDRHQELSGNCPFPVAPLPVNNSLLHDHPGFQEVNQTAQFKTTQSSPKLAISK